MVKKILLFCLFATLSFTGYSQEVLEGNVIDQSTGAFLPGANIGIKDTYWGTISNSDGNFSLKINEFPVTLSISLLGYESKSIVINREEVSKSKMIALKPTVINLGEVTVSNDFEINLVEKAIQKMLINKDQEIQGKAFYRQLTQSDSIYTEFMETFYQGKVNANGIKGLKVEQGRYAIIPKDSLKYSIYLKNFSKYLYTSIAQSGPYSPEKTIIWPLREDTREYYNFYLKKTYEQNDKKVYVIEFEIKENVKKMSFTGHIAIVEDSHDIQELDITISDPDYKPLETSVKKTTLDNVTMRLVYKNSFLDLDGRYYPKILNLDLTFDYIKKKGLFGKVDFKRRVHTQSFLYFFDYETEGLSRFFTDNYFSNGRDSDVADYQKIDNANYNPAFWENNPIGKRTPVEQKVIESFEKYGSFGKMFNTDKEEN